MPERIQLLDETLIDQIAAGEVVERPASVVKELLENAIDAGARTLRVDVEDGGRALLRVTDDGEGMSPGDATRSVQRHATSKIRRFEDLGRVRTLGFRGEALASIAAVSRFDLFTRDAEHEEGTHVHVEGGTSPAIAAIGCARGTTVEVRDLFYNVPARLKFLKSRPTELAHVVRVCTRLVLAHPEIRLTLTHDGRKVRTFLPAPDLPARAREVISDEPLESVTTERGDLRIEATLGAPERARAGATRLHLLVNDRPVSDSRLARAIAFAYGSVLPPGRYPSGVVRLTLPPDRVDVNVHPQKSEVRFVDDREVFGAVTRLLAGKLGTQAWGGVTNRPKSFWDERLGAAPANEEAGGTTRLSPSEQLAASLRGDAIAETVREYGAPQGAPHEGVDVRPAPLVPTGPYGALRVLGQLRRTYLVCEGEEGLVVLDQHAVDERIVFDRLRRAHRDRAVSTQALLFPERVDLDAEQAALVDEVRDALLGAGIDATLVGTTTVAVHAVPALVAKVGPAKILRAFLDELMLRGDRDFGDRVDMALATMACHAAIRAGDALSNDESAALLRALASVEDFAGHCPHGRPVVLTIPIREIERRVGR